MNRVLWYDRQIDLSAPEAKFNRQFYEAADLIEPGEELAEHTWKVLKANARPRPEKSPKAAKPTAPAKAEKPKADSKAPAKTDPPLDDEYDDGPEDQDADEDDGPGLVIDCKIGTHTDRASLFALLNRNNSFLKTPTALKHVIGHLEADFLFFLCNAMVNEKFKKFIVTENGEDWLRQNYKWLRFNVGIRSIDLLNTVRDRLVGWRLIKVRQPRHDRTLLWRPNYAVVERFYYFALFLRKAVAPVNYKTISIWNAFAAEYPDIVKEFAHLAPLVEKGKTIVGIAKRPFPGKPEMGISGNA